MRIEAQGHRVIEARDQAKPPSMQLMTADVSLVLTDLRLPRATVSACCARRKELDPALPVIVMTAFGGIQDAVAAMRQGRSTFLPSRSIPTTCRCWSSAR